MYSAGKFNSFKELLNEIGYSWEFPSYDFIKHDDGYELNKLFITPTRVSYKTEEWELAPGVYEEFEKFVAFLNSTKEGGFKNS